MVIALLLNVYHQIIFSVSQYNFSVKSMTVEAQTGNLYYADDDTEYIYVIGITKNGAYRKMLMKPAPEKILLANIQKIATDPLHR